MTLVREKQWNKEKQKQLDKEYRELRKEPFYYWLVYLGTLIGVSIVVFAIWHYFVI